MKTGEERGPVAPEATRLMERLTAVFCQEGTPRGVAAVLSLLMATPGAWSIDELVEELKLSKASVSLNTRLLEQMGYIERVFVPGERKVHFRLAEEAAEHTLTRQITSMRTLADLLKEGARRLPPSQDEVRRRLTEFGDFYDFLVEHIPELVAHWKGERDSVFSDKEDCEP